MSPSCASRSSSPVAADQRILAVVVEERVIRPLSPFIKSSSMAAGRDSPAPSSAVEDIVVVAAEELILVIARLRVRSRPLPPVEGVIIISTVEDGRCHCPPLRSSSVGPWAHSARLRRFAARDDDHRYQLLPKMGVVSRFFAEEAGPSAVVAAKWVSSHVAARGGSHRRLPPTICLGSHWTPGTVVSLPAPGGGWTGGGWP